MTSKIVPLAKAKMRLVDERPAPAVDIDRVLEISATQFAEQGFDGVSMREIGRECGYPTPSIYYHFTSKGELYREAYSNKIEHAIDKVNARLQCVSDKVQRFEVLIEAFHELFTNDRTLMLLTQRDVIDAAASERPFQSQRQFVYFNSLIRRVASEALGKPVSAETAFTIAALVFGQCELSLVIHHIQDAPDGDALRVERACLQRAAKAILGI